MNTWYDNDLYRDAIRELAGNMDCPGCQRLGLKWNCRVIDKVASAPFLIFAFVYPFQKDDKDGEADFFIITESVMVSAVTWAEKNGGVCAERIASALCEMLTPDREEMYAC